VRVREGGSGALKNKRIVTLVTATFITFSSLYTAGTDVALANEELKKKIEEAKQKLNENKGELQNTKTEIQQLEEQQAKIDRDMKRLDLAISEKLQEIREKNLQIDQTNEEIEELKIDITNMEERIAKRDELLKSRVRSVQKSGGVISYMDVLLGAKSFSDFLDRVSAVSTIVKKDKEILTQHRKDKEDLEVMKMNLTGKLVNLEEDKLNLEKLKVTLNGQRNEKEQLMKQLQAEEEEAHDELHELEDEAELLRKQKKASERLLALWIEDQKRKKELRQLQMSDGTFIRPTIGPITSNYGVRWGKLHAGVDIGKRGDEVPIMAVAPGIVFRSYYSSSYGNVVFITHNVDGKIWTTVYAHMEKRDVKEGEIVKKGQQLGLMGNTGRSFGAHLHFELHKGEWNSSKSNSVNPKKYIKF
jgi:peptidoglycan hydrolase CwlO-like protein